MYLRTSNGTVEYRGADPTLPWGSSYIPTNGQIGLSAAGMPMNDDYAVSITTVYACIRLLAGSVSTLDLRALKRTNDKSIRPVDPTPPLIEQPWPNLTLQDWLGQVMVSLTLRGNFFGQIVSRDERGYATSIMPLHPDWITARMVDGVRIYRVNGKPVDTNDILHIPAMTMPGGFMGINPVEYARSSWALAGAAERYGGQFFANSANPSGVISIEEDLSTEETLRLKHDWAMHHQGISKAQYPAVLTGGAKWTAMALTMDDAQFLQTRQFQDTQIMAWFGIPPHMLGAVDRTTSWGTGIEQQEIGFAINTLQMWTGKIESYLSNLLPKNQVAKFDLTSRLRGDTLQRFQAYTMARSGGWMNVDEIRDREDMPPIPGGAGQNYLQPMNMAPLGYDPTTDPSAGSAGSGGAGPNTSGMDNGGGNDGSPRDWSAADMEMAQAWQDWQKVWRKLDKVPARNGNGKH